MEKKNTGKKRNMEKSEYKLISAKNKNRIQKVVDAFSEKYNKKNNSKFGYKVLLGAMTAGAIACVLCGCTATKTGDKTQDGAAPIVYNYARDVGELSRGNSMTLDFYAAVQSPAGVSEAQYEANLVEYLSKKTGLDIKLVDMSAVRLVQSNGENFLIIESDTVMDVKKGTEKVNISLQISDELANQSQTWLTPYIYYTNLHDNAATTGTDDSIAAYKYDPEFLNGMTSVINDPSTKVVSIIQESSNTFAYYNEGLEQ